MRKLLPLLFATCLLLVAASAGAQPYYAPGAYQGWTLPQDAPQLVDDGTNGDVTGADGVYSRLVNIPTAGVYEWKAAIADWASSWPGTGNCWFITTADNQDVLLTFDVNAAGDGWAPDSYWPHSSRTNGSSYKVVGSLQSEMGDASDWDPFGGTLVMHDDGLGGDEAAGDGIYSYCGSVSTAGTHEWKIAVNADWAQQFGTDGPSVNAGTWFVTVENDGDDWCFELDLNRGRMRATPFSPVPTEVSTWGQIKSLHE